VVVTDGEDSDDERCGAVTRRAVLRPVAAFAVHHSSVALVLVIAAVAALAVGIPRLEFSSGQETLVPADSPVLVQTRQLQAEFGDSPVLVLLEGDVRTIVSPENRARLEQIEEQLLDTGRYHSVVGPHSSIQLALGIVGLPPEAADDPGLLELVVFDEDGGVRSQLRGQIPDDRHALLTARPVGGLTLEEQSVAVGMAEQAVADAGFEGLSVTVTGPQALLREVTDGMQEAMARMGLIVAGAMGLVLVLFVRGSWRLLPLLGVALGATAAFGVFGFGGITLTMVTISGLPVLLGMGVDFAIQTHSRYVEERASGGSDPGRTTLEALGPGLFVAMLAAVAGFLSLLLSPVPMISAYGAMLAIGVAILFVTGVVVTIGVLNIHHQMFQGHRLPSVPVEPGIRAIARSAEGRPGLVAIVALVIAAVGLSVDSGTEIASDPEGFIPQDNPVLAELDLVRQVTGSSSEISFLVDADDVTRPEVVEWLEEFAATQRDAHPEVTTAASFATLAAGVGGGTADPGAVAAVLDAAPPSLLDMFISPDRTSAHLVFAVSNVPLTETERIIGAITDAAAPPPGVRAYPGGLSVLGIETIHALQTNRVFMVYLALAGAALCLLLLTRSVVWAMLPLLPVLVAVGTAALVVAFLDIEMSPLAAISGPLIVAVCVEFAVLLCARYVEERQRGQAPEAAASEAAGRIGSAFAAAGLTTVAGFGALALSGFPLLESFGIVVAVNVVVALLATLVALPPLLVWADQRVGITALARMVATRPIEVATLRPATADA
jgi:uncharacterized protein